MYKSHFFLNSDVIIDTNNIYEPRQTQYRKDIHYSTTVKIRPSLPARHLSCRIQTFWDSTYDFWAILKIWVFLVLVISWEQLKII